MRGTADLTATPGRCRDLKRGAPPLASRTRQRLHSNHTSITAALGDQRRQRRRKEPLAIQAIAAEAVAMGIELAQRVEHDEIPGGHSGDSAYGRLLVKRWRNTFRLNSTYCSGILWCGPLA